MNGEGDGSVQFSGGAFEWNIGKKKLAFMRYVSKTTREYPLTNSTSDQDSLKSLHVGTLLL